MPLQLADISVGSIYRSRRFLTSCHDPCCANREIVVIDENDIIMTRSVGFDHEYNYTQREFRDDFRLIERRLPPKKKIGGFATFVRRIECVGVPVKPKRKRKIKDELPLISEASERIEF